MINRILVCLCLLVGLANAQWRSGGGSTFYWSLTGQAQKTDSLRIIQGTNMTITQSGNTVTFNGAAGAGSTANVRANTGWTSNGTTAQDTLATYYDINGKFQRLRIADTDGDSVIIAPHSLYPIIYKDGSSALFRVDSTGATHFTSMAIAMSGTIPALPANISGLFFGYDGANNRSFFSSGGTNGAGAFTSRKPAFFDYESFIFTHDGTARNIYITPTGTVGLSTQTDAQVQGLLTVRGNGTADTTLIVRNDKNATLDSTAMVFANGSILRRDTKQLPAGAWLATASNGAALSSSNYMVTYAFDTATAETLTVDFALPPNFIQVSNVEIEVVSPNTDGDSVGFAIAWLGRAADEAFNVTFSSPLSGQIDLGTSANVRKILTISGTFDNLAASDRLIFKLWRDPSVANDVAADVHLVDVRINGNGLLY